MTANRLLALVGTSTMMLEILLARQLGKILGSALDGVALAVTVALAGFAIGQIFSASVKERRSVPATWCRIAIDSHGVDGWIARSALWGIYDGEAVKR